MLGLLTHDPRCDVTLCRKQRASCSVAFKGVEKGHGNARTRQSSEPGSEQQGMPRYVFGVFAARSLSDRDIGQQVARDSSKNQNDVSFCTLRERM
jgi:hypothetical protein